MLKKVSFPIALIVCCLNLFAMDGFGIVIKCAGKHTMREGSIMRVDIQNDQVIKRSIIYNGADEPAHSPRICLDGKRIAFYRKIGSIYHLAIIDSDGQNLKNLVALTSVYTINSSGAAASISWPAGDWIYYQKEISESHFQYWRANAFSGEAELLLDGGRANKWRSRINFDATRICDNSDQCCDYPDGLFKSEQCFEARVRCNSGMSSSGRFLSGWGTVGECKWGSYGTGRWDCNYRATHYNDEDPSRDLAIRYHGWVDVTDMLDRKKIVKSLNYYHDYTNYRHISYSMGTQYLQEQIGVPTLYHDVSTAEQPLWSCNSDKWWLTSPVWMTVAWNWPERKGILLAGTKVKDGGAVSGIQKYMHADLWVKPPKDEYIGTHMEEINGDWIAAGQRSTCALPDWVECAGCADPYECNIKYRGIEIMPQSVYNKIAAPYSERCAGCANLIEEDWINSIVVQRSSSIDLTVTRDDYDPPVAFGDPPDISWKIIGQGATVSPASGTKVKLTTDGNFSECEVEVTVSWGSASKTVRKKASTTAVAIQKPSVKASGKGIQIASNGSGALNIAVAGGEAVSIAVYKADGTQVVYRNVFQNSTIIPSHFFNRGIYFFSVKYSNGQMVQKQWLAGLKK